MPKIKPKLSKKSKKSLNQEAITTPYGQWEYPGEITRIPSNQITMQGVDYPVYGVDDLGYSQMMYPGMDYSYPGSSVTEYPIMGFGGNIMLEKYAKGGYHGGLDRWFAEKWVDVKTGKPCGRQSGEKRKGYPACRPSKRVSSETPKTSSELSSSEKEKFKRSKTSSKKISYQHRRKEEGGNVNDREMVEGIADILSQVNDMKNRKKIARNMLSDFKDEGVNYNYLQFLEESGIPKLGSGGNAPTNSALWSRAKSMARSKFDVYPSAYANAWAAKWYKSKGGGWRKKEEGGSVWEIVEELPIAQGGTKVKPPLPISDYNEYVRRNQLYQDSLNLYNATNPLINPNASTMNAFGDSFNRLTSYNRQAPQLITNSFSTCTTGTCGKNTSTAQRQVYQMPVQPVTYQPKPAPSRPKVTTKPTVKNTVTPKPVVKQEQPTQKLLQEKPVIKKEIPVEMIEPKPKKILYYKYGSNEPVYAEKKYGGNINSEWEIVEDEYLYEMKEGGKTPAWQRKEGKSPSGGLNAKGRASYNRANPGSNLKAPQPQGGPRKKSFCARMKGHKKKNTSAKTANDPNSRINLALRKWKC